MAGQTFEFLGYQVDILTTLCLLLFMGAMGKSAQFLLHTWLPDAMEGPTPVSALIHAATMVTAGVFMVARLSPLYEHAPVALEFVTLIGAITAFFAATVGLVQNDIKRVVAYSTCSQLGYMFVACGVGAYAAGIFHLFTHAFFKALLFLGAGSVIRAMHHEQDMRKMGGLAGKLPLTFAMMLIGTLSLIGFGIPGVAGFAGFYSKDAIVEASYAAATPNNYAFWMLVIAAFMTAFYSWRLIFMTFSGPTRAEHHTFMHAHESPPVMLVPLAILPLGAVVAGAAAPFFIGESYKEFWGMALLEGEHNHILHAMHEVPDWVVWSPTIAMAAGTLVAVLYYLLVPSLPALTARVFRPIYLFLLNKWYFDELYDLHLRAPDVLARQRAVEGRRHRHHQRSDRRYSGRCISRYCACCTSADGVHLPLCIRHAHRAGDLITYFTFMSGGRWMDLASAPLLSIVMFLPLVGAVIIGFLNPEAKDNARWVALWTTVVTFLVSLLIWLHFDNTVAGFQFVETRSWLDVMKFKLGVDGISMLFVILTTFLMPLCIVQSWVVIDTRVKEYMIAFLVLETLMIGVFCALDLVLFYVFFEGGLIPMFLIIGIWGGPNRIYATLKFFLYTLLGSVLMLLAVMAMYWHTGTTDIPTLMTAKFPADMQWWLWLAFFASFAVKLPMWPVHTWLPDAHVEAPTAGSVILAAILLKMGGYGFLRFSVPMFPLASEQFAPFIFVLSVVAIIYTSLVALAQTDLKKLIAYSSVAHMGFVTLGIFTFSTQGIEGAIFQMVSHGIISAGLFLGVGVLYDRMHTHEIAAFGGLVNRMPVYAAIFMVFTLANVGLPGTSGFIGEFLTLLAAFKVSTWVAFLATIGRDLVGGLCALGLPARPPRPARQAVAQVHPGHELPRDRHHGAARRADAAPGRLSGAGARRHGRVGEEARGGLRDGRPPVAPATRPQRAARRRPARPHPNAWSPDAMGELTIYAPALPEIVLAVGAMAILMLGVFRASPPGDDAVANWAAIVVLLVAAGLVRLGRRGARGAVRRRLHRRRLRPLHEASGAGGRRPRPRHVAGRSRPHQALELRVRGARCCSPCSA